MACAVSGSPLPDSHMALLSHHFCHGPARLTFEHQMNKVTLRIDHPVLEYDQRGQKPPANCE